MISETPEIHRITKRTLSEQDKLNIAYNLLCVVHREAQAGNAEAKRFIEEAIETQLASEHKDV